MNKRTGTELETLVFMNDRQTESYTDTLVIVKELDMAHSDILKIVRRLIKKELISQGNISLSDYTKRGKVYPKYNLSLSGARRLLMSCSSPRAEEVKTIMNNAFDDMRQFLSTNEEWQRSRVELKQETKTLHDAVQPLVKRLTAEYPSSGRGTKFYIHLHKAVNEVALGKGTGVNRDLLTTKQIERIEQIEGDIVRMVSYFEARDFPSELIRWQSLAVLNLMAGREKKPTDEITVTRYD